MEQTKLTKLTEESLTRQPEEVFDILSKLGEGSYGSVFKALHKESSQILAIKQVPVDTDLQEIIKEISIMQQCDSPYVVKYYGSYFKNTDLWIVMEYCGAGSVLDIMKLRGIHHNMPRGEVKTMSEDEIATILSDTLKGLEYLHLRKKIHRDIKAGNILLNSEGHAKLADFGVAGQLTDTMAKRNTVIGTPFWMAPEVIQEIGYDCAADMWSLGITSLEMAEGKAPYGEIHPMRAIFMIPSKPPPSFSKPDQWSPQFIDFVSRCLVKSPEKRATASELLQHDFIKDPKPPESLSELIKEAHDVRERLAVPVEHSRSSSQRSGNDTLDGDATLIRHDGEDDGGTMIQHATLIPENNRSLESNMGTMVINNDEESDEDTMKRHDTPEYRPSYLDHFENPSKSDTDNKKDPNSNRSNTRQVGENSHHQPPPLSPMAVNPQLQRQLEQIAGRGINANAGGGIAAAMAEAGEKNKPENYQQSLLEGDFEFLKYLSYEELTYRMANIDGFMEREIDDLRRRYHAKRQPILDAMDQKRKLQQNF